MRPVRTVRPRGVPTLGVSSRGRPRRSRPPLPTRRHGRTLLITPRSRASETETDDEPQPEVLSAYALLFGTLGLGEFVLPTNSPISPLPYFGALALASVFIGSKRGLKNREVEMISLSQGASAPVFLSFSLLGLYGIQKLEIDLQTFLNGYFLLLETVSGTISLWLPLKAIGAATGEKALGTVDLSFVVKSERTGETLPADQPVRPSALLCLAVAATLAYLDRYGGQDSFTLNNLEASFLVTTWLELLGVNSFRTATALLFGLLFYDVLWVFGSGPLLRAAASALGGEQGEAILPKYGSVMADVAMSPVLSTPTKFLFPRDAAVAAAAESSSFDFSLLGLGDVLIPGLLIGLLLRFEGRASKGSEGGGGGGGGGYFAPALFAYGAGLLVSFAASFVSGKGQPALLYLVPLTVGSALLVGTKNKEVGELWSFQTSGEDEERD
ncbi:signal peptide peptidase [Chloropicon roscoffensis]|uniref:Signal peptide peptidase n=1 Tax=Chloropicon roscoffensis TaxID=1461544 RepID=A0AAX4NZJ2_9CHLO